MKWIKRNTRSWVECDVCRKDIKWGTSETEYWQKNGHGKRYCRNCYLQLRAKNWEESK
jgi:hypothetical protein